MIIAATLSLGVAAANAACVNYPSDTGDGVSVGGGMQVGNWFPLTRGGWALTTVCNPSSFSFQWNIPGYGFLAGVGRNQINKTLTTLNPYATASYNVTLTDRSGGSRYGVNTGLYGWMFSNGIAGRLTEWYIVENWFGTYPNSGQWMGRFYANGSNYDVYRDTGSKGQDQWISVRANRSGGGTINYVQHFNKWKQLNGGNPISNKLGSLTFMVEPQWSGYSRGEVKYTNVNIQLP